MVTSNQNPSEKGPEPDVVDSWQLEEDPLMEVIELAERFLSYSTGHDGYQRRNIAYYIVATYFVPKFDPFPGLVLYGPPSTGKSATLDIVRRLCWRPVGITGETITQAALKECMSKANLGTLIIEEADKLSVEELEGILITRYSKPSADWKKMVPDGKSWILAEHPTFGATVLHRRNLFKDPALLRRVIRVKTKRQKGDYSPVAISPKLHSVFETNLREIKDLPVVTNTWGIEPGIFDCYRPLIAMAHHIDDAEFFFRLLDEMRAASNELKDEETYLEPSILLRVIIALVDEATGGKFTLNRINLPICRFDPALREEFSNNVAALKLSANQRNHILREDFGLEVKSSHGRQRLYLTIPQLIEKCDESGVEDDLIEEWRRKLKGQ